MIYRTIVRKQFIFVVDDQKLACLLTLNSNPAENLVNIVAMTVQKLENKNENYVRIVIGPNKLHTNNNMIYQQQQEHFISNLIFLKIEYYENNVVQILNAGTPDFYRVVLVALYCAGIPIRSYYPAEPLVDEKLSAIIDIPQRYLYDTIQTIKNINTIDPDSNLYINHSNVKDKCLIINNGHNILSDL